MAVAHRDVAGLLRKKGYTEVRKIGEGSFGKAILVQARDGSKLVCKMVDVSKATAKEQRDALQEGQLLSSLKHPYIVRYRENFTEAGWFCILMDFCEGGDLTKQVEKARRSRQPLSEEQVLRWFTQAILALKYIHDRHILHRDLKPGNFFLSKTGSMKMGDFGIAKVLSCTVACAKTQIGTPYYLSPEVCQEKPYSWASDIWAMGCILYELCAMKVPFDAPNIQGLVQKIVRGPTPTVPNQYSEFVRHLCTEMLNRNPNGRPSTDDILKRPKIQSIVRQMLDEANQASDSERSPAEPSRAAPSPAPAAPSPAPPAGGYVYKRGDLVEYFSNTHGDWLPATVVNVDANGRAIIDLKPSSWMSKEELAKKVRPRRAAAAAAPQACNTPMKGAAPGPNPVRAVATPLRQRSPSAAALGPGAPANNSPARGRSPSVRALDQGRYPAPPGGASPLQQRSPSVQGTPRASPTPSPAPRDFSPARGFGMNNPSAPGSRASSPRRGFSPAPPVNGAPAYPGGALAGQQGIRPPALPPRMADQSPLRRGGRAIAGA